MNYTSYLSFVLSTIEKNLESGSPYMTVAALGTVLRTLSPSITWKNFDKQTLSQVLADLQAQNKVHIIHTPKNALAVTLPQLSQDETPADDASSCFASVLTRMYGSVDNDSSMVSSPTAPSSSLASATAPLPRSHPFLRVHVWNAFIMLQPEGRRFFDKVSGRILTGVMDEAPFGDQWIEIPVISADEQKNWGHNFVLEHCQDLEDKLSPFLHDPMRFVHTLKTLSPDAARSWNSIRTAKVISAVNSWASTHHIDHVLLFQQAEDQTAQISAPKPSLEITQEASCTTLPETAAPFCSLSQNSFFGLPEEAIKKAILEALSTLPLATLLELPVPSGALLNALVKGRCCSN